VSAPAWYRTNTFAHGDFPPERLATHRDTTVSVCLPARDEARTIGSILQQIEPLRAQGIVDQVVVVDRSTDGTSEIARSLGAEVHDQEQLWPEQGPVLGKGDAMWRALRATAGELVCFLDGDTADPNPRHLQGLLGPLLADRSLALVKGAFERPLDADGVKLAHEGGRVTELMARPLLNLREPLLAGFTQPLAGEFAARRRLLERCAFPVGYGIEIAVLIDALRACGLDALAECHLGTRQNRHQPLRALGEMAYAVLVAVENRLGGTTVAGRRIAGGRYVRPWEDGAVASVAVAERPPIRPRLS
jgi:glucosyl-3-phosphoglycerate synthase